MGLLSVLTRFPDQQACIEHLEEIRFGGGPFCPLCGCVNVARKRDGHRMGRWNCYACRSSFNVLSGTLFQKTKIPLRKWFLAIQLMLNARKGISSHQVGRDLDMCQQAAWSMMKRIREAMNERLTMTLLQGIIEADETYIGAPSHRRGRGTEKTAVLGAVERGGNVVAEVIPNVSSETIRDFVEYYIRSPRKSQFISDGLHSYRPLGSYIKHKVLKRHGRRFRNQIHTNTIESVWALLKRARYGAHHQYRPENTQLYVAEMCYKYNTRKDSDAFGTFLEGCFT